MTGDNAIVGGASSSEDRESTEVTNPSQGEVHSDSESERISDDNGDNESDNESDDEGDNEGDSEGDSDDEFSTPARYTTRSRDRAGRGRGETSVASASTTPGRRDHGSIRGRGRGQ